jgi:hypothetical protein
MASLPQMIPALLPRGPGHQFVVYGDACSGVPGAPHERSFAEVNAVVRRLSPPPEFIVFTGDEIAGLRATAEELRQQWRYWLDHEMAWLNRRAIPLWHATGNHTAYAPMSEAVFRDVLDMPHNGPPGQEGLSYWVRRDDLLLVFVHTLWSGLGGEGHVETAWLDTVLRQHADARYKLVVGHHPVFSVNGFAGAYVRDIGPEHAGMFWDTLVSHDVLAYLCSHILAFDVQVHRGVLQVCTAGAGTLHRMPEGSEYLHCAQIALDATGLRCQVLDTSGHERERVVWPVLLPPDEMWRAIPIGEIGAMVTGGDRVVSFRFWGRTASDHVGAAQTLLSAFDIGVLAPLWIGLCGPEQVLTVIIGPETGRSPHIWYGPAIRATQDFDITLLLHSGMGPGGVLYRMSEGSAWSSLNSASPWGVERLHWPSRWNIGHGQHGTGDRRFCGADLRASMVAI